MKFKWFLKTVSFTEYLFLVLGCISSYSSVCDYLPYGQVSYLLRAFISSVCYCFVVESSVFLINKCRKHNKS